jgi:GGDEF domain-containing protein
MSHDFIAIDHNSSIHTLSHLIVESNPRHLVQGFVVTKDGHYLGMGSGHGLMREVTRLQIQTAKYSNPLTGLPGNVPINEHFQALIDLQSPFVAVYADLDHFKPYNDVYGYHRGDEIIRFTSNILETVCDLELDFLGHLGGDDFLLAFRSPDWRERCQNAISLFDGGVNRFFIDEHIEAGGYMSEDRLGNHVFHPLVSLSLGAVRVEPKTFQNAHELSTAAGIAKREAKRSPGSSLFIERRAWDSTIVKTLPGEPKPQPDPKAW